MPRQTAQFYILLTRRRFLKALALALAGFTPPGYLAEALTLSPEITQGPFYPLAKSILLDDNDLIYLGTFLAPGTNTGTP